LGTISVLTALVVSSTTSCYSMLYVGIIRNVVLFTMAAKYAIHFYRRCFSSIFADLVS
uniref:7TM_GPCR_Srx domain-containing protein n=1 Tax=Haemonchus placei TaxID=6290 RepID=A0A0N4WU47_HAEPC